MPPVRLLMPPGNLPTELKADPGLPGKILARVDDWILKKAERREDAWDFLLGVKGLPAGCYDLFKAAKSVQAAMRQMMHMPYGGATLNRIELDELISAKQRGDKRSELKLVEKLVKKGYEHGFWREEHLNTLPQHERALMEPVIERIKSRILKRAGSKGLQARSLTEPQAVIRVMIVCWLRWGVEGDPGLCFYSDEALANFLDSLQGQVDRYKNVDRVDYYRKVRQRLRLDHAYYRLPTIIRIWRMSEVAMVRGVALERFKIVTRAGESASFLTANRFHSEFASE